ncbi:Putative ammonia monooxygenase [Roseovarius sp. THAF27]|uniref:AbrB family transcriptional regulator n=1 Tax=Roseovarius sp. THAF27 TaxID=2587850 RepID=UPI001268C513|nr:AbrB family transcriptional regulator [Roseovarius sp. THAF27]QFT81998.1 Putative ammonia monooxygenase [Roseovarius sp. THAF27]
MTNTKTQIFRGLTFLGAVCGGAILARIGVPLGWLVGAMLVIVAASLTHVPVFQPKPVMPYVRGAVGAMLGASIPAGLFGSLSAWWPSLLIMFALMLTGLVINFLILRRMFSVRPVDAALCAMPGGITEMIVFGESAGGDARRVAITHALRIALSILAIPILAAGLFHVSVSKGTGDVAVSMSAADWFWFGACMMSGVLADRYSRIPAGFVIVPMALSAGLHLGGVSDFGIPPSVSIAVQVLIGINVGSRFLGFTLRELTQVALSALTIVSVQLVLAIIAATTMATTGRWDPLALLLAYAPGGLAEMSLIAIGMGREVAFVACHHIMRVLTSLFLAPPALKRLTRMSP